MQSDIKLENEKVIIEGDVLIQERLFVEKVVGRTQFEGDLTVKNGLTVEGSFSAEVGVLTGIKWKVDSPPQILCLAQDFILTNNSSSGFALSATDDNKLIINRDSGYKGGVVIEGELQVEELYGNKINAIVCKTTDLILDSEERRSEGHKGPEEMRRALVHDVDDSLTINYLKDYPGGVYIQGKIKVEELYGYPTNAIICRTTDLILDSDERRSEGHKSPEELRRALVHDTDDNLTINYAGDYPGGVAIEGKVKVPDELIIGSPLDGISITKENIKLRTTKTPPANDEADQPQRGERLANGKFNLTKIIVVPEKTIAEELKATESPLTNLDLLPPVYEFDLVEQIYELRSELNALKAQLAELKSKA